MVRLDNVYLDVGIGSNLNGRVVFELFDDVSEKIIKNFISLCRGDIITAKMGKRCKLSYDDSRFFKIVKGQYIMGGDIDFNDGTSSTSIYAGYITEVNRNNQRLHLNAGILTIVNMGNDTFGSQFCITLGKVLEFDTYRYYIIGRVINGMELIRAIENIPVTMSYEPTIETGILSCGLINNEIIIDKMYKQRNLVNKLMDTLIKDDQNDNSIKCVYSGRMIHKKSSITDSATTIGKQLLKDALSGKQIFLIPQDKTNTINDISYHKDNRTTSPHETSREVSPAVSSSNYLSLKSKATPGDRGSDEGVEDVTSSGIPESDLRELEGEINRGGTTAVGRRVGDEGSDVTSGEVPESDLRELEGELKEGADGRTSGGVDDDVEEVEDEITKRLKILSKRLDECNKFNKSDKTIDININNNKEQRTTLDRELNMPALAVEKLSKLENSKNKKREFGWNVFNQDALYRAHKKRLNETEFNKNLYDYQKLMMGDSFYDPGLIDFNASELSKDMMVRNLEKQYKKRSEFSRRRLYDDDMKDISYINERNRIFNKKLDRSFGEYSKEIKQNLERGTAL